MEALIVGVGSSLIAAIIAGWAEYMYRGVRFKKTVTSAPEIYIAHLDCGKSLWNWGWTEHKG